MKRGRGGGGGNRLKLEPAKNQSKITQFFTRGAAGQGNSSSGGPSRPVFRQTSLLGTSSRTNIQVPTTPVDYTDVEGEIEVLTPPPKEPKELVILSSSESDDDSGQNNVQKDEEKEENNQSVLGELSEEVSKDPSNNFILPEVTDKVENGLEEIKSKDADAHSMTSDSSGDEILSQIDIEEVVRLSQSSEDCSKNQRTRSPSVSPSLLDEVDVIQLETLPKSTTEIGAVASSSTQKPPKRSPRSQVNKFSPVKHLRIKRTSSQASLDGNSPFKTPTKATNRNSDGGATTALTPNGTPYKKKLQFDSPPSGSGRGNRYYLKNFMSILTEVISDSFHSHLINDDDHKMVQNFTFLSLDAQCLYVRLFQRKWDWKPINKLNNNYKELPPDLTDLCNELLRGGFFEEISAANASLENVLDTLDLVKTNNLAKKMMISTQKKTKEAIREALLIKVKSQKTLMGGNGVAAALKTALAELGQAVRVSQGSKTLFSRLFILYSPPAYWDVEQDQASNQLLIILLNNRGQMLYPSYKISKSTVIFKDRQELIKFHEMFSLHSNLIAFIESKDWESCVELANTASALFQKLLNQSDIIAHDSSLPRYLRIYTAGSVLCHTCWMGVDGFQKLKRFAEANELLNVILGQSIYLPNYRGRCWERLSINSGHLKKKREETCSLLEEALSDKYLQENHKLILGQRLQKLREAMKAASSKKQKGPSTKKEVQPKGRTKAKNSRKKYVDESSSEDSDTGDNGVDFIDDNATQVLTVEEEGDPCPVQILTLKHQVPTRTITGEKMDRGPGSMGKSIFISKQDSTGSNRMSSVEQHAIHYYLENEGYTEGLHGEGSTIVTLYGLLFWDIIFYDDLTDAFHNRYQAFPLDLHFDDFYLRRKDLIEEKLQLIRQVLSVEELCQVVDEIWEKHENKLSIVSWSLFENNLIGLKSLMKAMGTGMIASLCERLAKNYRYFSSGFPDIVLWNEHEAGKVLFVEVKGPGDSLRPKQELWLEFLIESGIPAEICLVKAVSNKRIRLDA